MKRKRTTTSVTILFIELAGYCETPQLKNSNAFYEFSFPVFSSLPGHFWFVSHISSPLRRSQSTFLQTEREVIQWQLG